MSRPSVTSAIASVTNLDQLRMLLEATRLTLDAALIEILDRASVDDSARAA